MCHHNTFLIYGSIQDADQHRWDTVTHASILTSLVASALFGIAGYATFTGNSQGSFPFLYVVLLLKSQIQILPLETTDIHLFIKALYYPCVRRTLV